jgi:hypothetical protein
VVHVEYYNDNGDGAGGGQYAVPSSPMSSSAVKVTAPAVNPGKPLRKGKWTAEEENYTSAIIDFFSKG